VWSPNEFTVCRRETSRTRGSQPRGTNATRRTGAEDCYPKAWREAQHASVSNQQCEAALPAEKQISVQNRDQRMVSARDISLARPPVFASVAPGVWNALRATKSPVENVFACRPALYECFETRSMSNRLITSAAISGRGRTRYTLYSTGQTQQGFCRPL